MAGRSQDAAVVIPPSPQAPFQTLEGSLGRKDPVELDPTERSSESPTASDEARSADVPQAVLIQDSNGWLTPELAALADSLGRDPARIYDHLRNTYDFEPYFGLMKGPQETWYQEAGNAADLSALLVTLLRYSGFEAQYAVRTVALSGDELAAWVGVESPWTALQILADQGHAVEYRANKGQIRTVLLEHVWVEARIDGGWRALDPSFKQYTVHPGQDAVTQAGWTGERFDELVEPLADFDPVSGRLTNVDVAGIERVKDVMALDARRYRETHDPQLTMEQAAGYKTIVPQPVDALARRIDLRGRGRTTRLAEIGDGAAFFTRVQIKRDDLGVTLLDETLRIPDLAGQRVSVSYTPASPSDEAAIAAAGDILDVAPFSVWLRPELRVGGQVVAVGEPAPIGYYFQMDVTFLLGDQFRGTSNHVVTIGGSYNIALDVQRTAPRKIGESIDRLEAAIDAGADELGDAVMGEMLYLLGLYYFMNVDVSGDLVAGRTGTAFYQEIQQGMTGLDLRFSPDFSFLHLGGMGIDVKRANYGIRSSDNAPDYDPIGVNLAYGTLASWWESQIFAHFFAGPAVSTISLLNEAINNEVPVAIITPPNVGLVDGLAVSQFVKDTLRDQLSRGSAVVIPETESQLGMWRGASWIEINPVSGGFGYWLAGSTNGGAVMLTSGGATPFNFDLRRFIHENLSRETRQQIVQVTKNTLAAAERVICGDRCRPEGWGDPEADAWADRGSIVREITPFVPGLVDSGLNFRTFVDSGYTDWGALSDGLADFASETVPVGKIATNLGKKATPFVAEWLDCRTCADQWAENWERTVEFFDNANDLSGDIDTAGSIFELSTEATLKEIERQRGVLDINELLLSVPPATSPSTLPPGVPEGYTPSVVTSYSTRQERVELTTLTPATTTGTPIFDEGIFDPFPTAAEVDAAQDRAEAVSDAFLDDYLRRMFDMPPGELTPALPEGCVMPGACLGDGESTTQPAGGVVSSREQFYFQASSGRWVVNVTVLFAGEASNVVLRNLQVQVDGKVVTVLTADWLRERLDAAVEQGYLTRSQANSLLSAWNAGNVDVVLNVARADLQGGTVSDRVIDELAASGNSVQIVSISFGDSLVYDSRQ